MFPLLYTDSKSGELRKRTWQLKILEGADAGASCTIDRSPVLIGAAPAATLVLSDDTVSRYHLEIDAFAEGIRLRDLDSTNGTFFNEERVRDAFVEDRDVFRVGRTAVQVIGTDEAAAPEIDTDPRGLAPGATETIGDALAVDPWTRNLFLSLRKIAPSPSTVLLVGAPGSGKATCAQLIHELSPRKDQPFVRVEIPVRASAQQADELCYGSAGLDQGTRNSGTAGAFERAAGGTLLIDSIDRLPRDSQPKLLRGIESGEISRNGDPRRRRVHVRLVATSPEPLAGITGFLPALVRRLGVIQIPIRSLRQRPEDLLPLARLFLLRSSLPLIPGDRVAAVLRGHPWPGNLDQLRRSIEDLSDSIKARGLEQEPAGLVAALRLALISDLLSHKGGDVTACAKPLAAPASRLFEYLARHEVDLDSL